MSKILSTAAAIIVLGSVPALATNYHDYRPWEQTQTQAQPHYTMRHYGGPKSSQPYYTMRYYGDPKSSMWPSGG
jgi:hypothetical protein